jgi:hypothetical protein
MCVEVPSWVLAAVALGANLVVVADARSPTYAEPAASPPAPIAQVMVRGSVTDGCEPLAFEPVRVGDALVATDLSGHFAAITTARRTLRVEAGPIGEPDRSFTLVRDLAGAGGVQVVDLGPQDVPFLQTLQRCPYGGCVTCPRGR